MTKLNHERPNLKYKDNIVREINKASRNSEIDIVRSTSRLRREISFKLPNIELTNEELCKVNKFMRLLNKHQKMQAKLLIPYLHLMLQKKRIKEKNVLKNKINQELSKLRISLISIALQLVASDRLESIAGRKQGVLDWFNSLGESLCKNNTADLWYFIHDDIFNVAIEIYKDKLASITPISKARSNE